MITKEEFIKRYCEKSNITKSQLLEFAIILPCDCDEKICKGWQVKSIKTVNNGKSN